MLISSNSNDNDLQLAGAKRRKFTFIELPVQKIQSLESKEVQHKLMKWSMKGRLNVKSFTFDEPFKCYDNKEFVEELFRSEVVTASLGLSSLKDRCLTCTSTEVLCTATQMSAFRPILEHLTRPDGYIKKCMDYTVEGVLISDVLRKCILDEESEEYSVVPPDLRKEFLFKLFGHICIGGELCQNEDNVNEYFEILRPFYRDLISVYKHPESKSVEVASRVYRVQIEDENGWIFPQGNEHVNTFAYVIVDSLRRNVHLLFHVFGCGEF